MSMIKGKLEASREISPRFSIVGESKFVRKGDDWIVPSEPGSKVSVVSLDEAFFDVSKEHDKTPNTRQKKLFG